MTLTWRAEHVVAGDGKSQVFYAATRLQSSETKSYREKHIAIRISTLKILSLRIEVFFPIADTNESIETVMDIVVNESK